MCAQFLKMGPVLDHQSFCYFVPWNSIMSRADIQTHNFSHNLSTKAPAEAEKKSTVHIGIGKVRIEAIKLMFPLSP